MPRFGFGGGRRFGGGSSGDDDTDESDPPDDDPPDPADNTGFGSPGADDDGGSGTTQGADDDDDDRGGLGGTGPVGAGGGGSSDDDDTGGLGGGASGSTGSTSPTSDTQPGIVPDDAGVPAGLEDPADGGLGGGASSGSGSTSPSSGTAPPPSPNQPSPSDVVEEAAERGGFGTGDRGPAESNPADDGEVAREVAEAFNRRSFGERVDTAGDRGDDEFASTNPAESLTPDNPNFAGGDVRLFEEGEPEQDPFGDVIGPERNSADFSNLEEGLGRIADPQDDRSDDPVNVDTAGDVAAFLAGDVPEAVARSRNTRREERVINDLLEDTTAATGVEFFREQRLREQNPETRDLDTEGLEPNLPGARNFFRGASPQRTEEALAGLADELDANEEELASAATVGVATPEPSSTAAGALTLGLLGVAALDEQNEIDVPDERPEDSGEIEEPTAPDALPDELAVPESPRTRPSELDVDTGRSVTPEELDVPDPADGRGEVDVPQIDATQVARGTRLEEEEEEEEEEDDDEEEEENEEIESIEDLIPDETVVIGDAEGGDTSEQSEEAEEAAEELLGIRDPAQRSDSADEDAAQDSEEPPLPEDLFREGQGSEAADPEDTRTVRDERPSVEDDFEDTFPDTGTGVDLGQDLPTDLGDGDIDTPQVAPGLDEDDEQTPAFPGFDVPGFGVGRGSQSGAVPDVAPGLDVDVGQGAGQPDFAAPDQVPDQVADQTPATDVFQGTPNLFDNDTTEFFEDPTTNSPTFGDPTLDTPGFGTPGTPDTTTSTPTRTPNLFDLDDDDDGSLFGFDAEDEVFSSGIADAEEFFGESADAGDGLPGFEGFDDDTDATLF